MNDQLDVNDLVNGLLEQVAQQAKEIAVLRAHLMAYQKPKAAGGEEEDGNE